MRVYSPWMGVCVLLFVQGCAPSTHSNQSKQLLAKPVAYFNEINRLDDPEARDTLSLNAISSGKYANRLSPRFTNSDKSQLLTTEFNYFNNEIDTIGVRDYVANQLTRLTWYGAPGLDGIWQTADDVVASYHDHAPVAADVLYTIYRGFGPDQTWFTTDDDILYYIKPLTDANNTVIGLATYTLPGADNTWFTADDFIGWLNTESTAGNEIQRVMYLGSGPDNDWSTFSDNNVYRFSLSTLNAMGDLERYAFFQATGADNIPFTADDLPLYYVDYRYDAQDRVQEAITFADAGPDATWFTTDDHIRNCKQQLRDVNDIPNRTISYRAGADLQCFTADDVVWGYHDDSFDINNVLTTSDSYFQPGEDTIWFNADDVKIYSRLYQPPTP